MAQKTLYLDAWNYNANRIIKRIEKLVFDMDGCIVSSFQNELDNYHYVARFSNYKGEIWTDDKICFDSNYKGYISFYVNGFIYYLQFDNNPFFEHFFTKQASTADELATQYRVYMDELNKQDFMFDCLFSFDCTDDEIKEISNLVFNQLMNAKPSRVSTTRRRVYHNYGRNYHYEKYPDKYRRNYHIVKEANE